MTKSKRLFLILLVLRGLAAAVDIQAAGVPVLSCKPVLEDVDQQRDWPSDWRIIVVNERVWAKYMSQVDHQSLLAVTDRKQRITILRAAGVADPNLTGHYIELRHVLAHELGHVLCDCNDEWKAESHAKLSRTRRR